MPADRKIYLLNPKELSPETIAVAFAKTSRSPKSFQEIAVELSEESSADFHEKWVVGYGHASVAEHAVLHIAFENISRLAVETLEGNRLASFTEKSTRYQKWDANSYYLPFELTNHLLLEPYKQTCKLLFETYQNAIPAVKSVIENLNPQNELETTEAWARRIRSDYIDVCRFLLPAASLANVGVTMNARNIEHALCKMLSHPLEEVRSLGVETKRVASKEIPTLVKYADAEPNLKIIEETFSHVLVDQGPEVGDFCRLVSYDANSEERVFGAILYRYGLFDYAQCLSFISKLSPGERQSWASTILGNLGKHDIPLRELEHTTYTFDIILDQGAYFELKRHRMMTQTPQALTVRSGYVVPKAFQTAHFLDEYQFAMESAKNIYEEICAFNPHVASYIVPNAFRRRVLLTMNLRSAFHFIRLRSSPNAHFSIRRIARKIAEQISQATPLFASYFQFSNQENWKGIEDQFFFQV